MNDLDYLKDMLRRRVGESLGQNIEIARVNLASLVGIHLTTNEDNRGMLFQMIEEIPTAEMETLDSMFRSLLYI